MPRPILVASSDELRRWVAEDALSRNGFEVITVRSGLECLERIRTSRYAAVVLDPDLLWGGAEGVMDFLRRTEDGPTLPVVVLGRPADRGSLPGLTARYVEEPTSVRDVLASVRQALASSPPHSPDDTVH